MSGRHYRMAQHGVALAIAAAWAVPAMAHPPPAVAVAPAAAVPFDIAPGALAGVLEQFARQARVQILFPYEQARRLRSAGLRGTMAVPAALRRLLAGQPLRIVTSNGGRIVLADGPGPAPRPPAPRPLRAPRAPVPLPLPPAVPAADIIVTGRASGDARDAASSSYAVSSLDLSGAGSGGTAPLADLFRRVPGFWVEASGGEGSNNVRSRGIPTDGYTSVALAENGLPVQYDGGLGYLNTDQSFRRDRTIARVEIVRGGPASLFTPNAPGGVANFITRSALTAPGGLIEVTGGDSGYGRLDAIYAARLTANLGLMAGGFYRRDDGPRPAGFRADEGGQGRLALDYQSGGTRLGLDLRRLDDRVTFYLPVPLRLDANGAVAAIPGFDPLHDALAGPELLHVRFPPATGLADFDLTRGTQTRLTAATLRLDQQLGAALSYHGALRWRTSDTQRNGLFPVGVPQTGADYLASIRPALLQAFPGMVAAVLRYAADGAPLPASANGNGLVLGANLLAVRVPLDELLADQRINLHLRAGGPHELALGLTLARYSYRFERSMSTALIDVRGAARLVDAVAVGPDGGVLGGYTSHGIQRFGSLFDDAGIRVDAAALYAADEWQMSPGLRLDYGLRWERNRIRGTVASKALADLGDPATLADNQVWYAAGARIPVDRRYSGLGWSLGASLRLDPRVHAFLRLTKTFRLPSASEFNGSPLRTDEAVVPIRLAEAGLSYGDPRLTVAAAAFYTRFDRLPFTDYRFDSVSNSYQERTAIAGSETIGTELEATWKPSAAFTLALEATWQAPRYRNFTFTDLVYGAPVARDYSGNQLIRVPRLALRATPTVLLDGGRLRIELPVARYSARYADIANLQRLPGYTLVDLSLAWKLSSRVTAALDITNLTDAIGLTEGNPRSGSFTAGSAPGSYFLARPEFGRRIRLSISRTL